MAADAGPACAAPHAADCYRMRDVVGGCESFETQFPAQQVVPRRTAERLSFDVSVCSPFSIDASQDFLAVGESLLRE